MRIIIDTKEQPATFTQTHKYSFTKENADDNIAGWLPIFREILLNVSFDFDLIAEAIPFRKGEEDYEEE